MCWDSFKHEICQRCQEIIATQGSWRCRQLFKCNAQPIPAIVPIISNSLCQQCKTEDEQGSQAIAEAAQWEELHRPVETDADEIALWSFESRGINESSSPPIEERRTIMSNMLRDDTIPRFDTQHQSRDPMRPSWTSFSTITTVEPYRSTRSQVRPPSYQRDANTPRSPHPDAMATPYNGQSEEGNGAYTADTVESVHSSATGVDPTRAHSAGIVPMFPQSSSRADSLVFYGGTLVARQMERGSGDRVCDFLRDIYWRG